MKVPKTEKRREIPLDQPLKILILILHAIGFSVWFGGTVISGSALNLFVDLTIISGALLVLRELYKDGWSWIRTVEGGLTILKVALLALTGIWASPTPVLLVIVLAGGSLSSHLPKGIRETRILPSVKGSA